MPGYITAHVQQVQKDAGRRLWDEDTPPPRTIASLNENAAALLASLLAKKQQQLRRAPAGPIFPEMPTVQDCPRREAVAKPGLRAKPSSVAFAQTRSSCHNGVPNTLMLQPESDKGSVPTSLSACSGLERMSTPRSADAMSRACMPTHASNHSRHIRARSQRLADRDTPIANFRKESTADPACPIHTKVMPSSSPSSR